MLKTYLHDVDTWVYLWLIIEYSWEDWNLSYFDSGYFDPLNEIPFLIGWIPNGYVYRVLKYSSTSFDLYDI